MAVDLFAGDGESQLRSPTKQDAGVAQIPRRFWALMALVGLLVSILPATSAYIALGSGGLSRWLALFQPLAVFYGLWLLASPLIFRCTGILSRRSIPAALAVHTSLAVSLVVLFGWLCHQPNWRAWLLGQHAPGYYAMGLSTYLLVVLACLALRYHQVSIRRQAEADAARLRTAQLRGRFDQVRADALQQKMNPHFLFNALNSVGALIETGAAADAYRSVELLGRLLRRVLTQEDQTTLGAELALVRDYLAMEQVRFGERLCFELQCPTALEAAELPSLVLQPLVENAVVHGVSRTDQPVRISVLIDRRNDELEARVTDNAGGLPPASSGTGTGLNNLRQRLQLRYGSAASLSAGPRPEGGFAARLLVPLVLPSTN